MRIFNGKKKADRINSELKRKIRKRGSNPGLAVISASSDPASKLFIRNKKRVARKIGIKVFHYKFRSNVREKTILERVRELNSNEAVSGIIVQLPLPKELNTNKIISQISLKKDIDGFRKKSCFSSPLISAILISLKTSTNNLKKKKIVALVNSDFFGKTLKLALQKERIKISYLKNRQIPEIKSADIIITVLGKPRFLKGKMIKKGAILIDSGITVKGKNKVVGDVDRESIAEKASFLAPVPGGIGPLNIALLLKNVYIASK